MSDIPNRPEDLSFFLSASGGISVDNISTRMVRDVTVGVDMELVIHYNDTTTETIPRILDGFQQSNVHYIDNIEFDAPSESLRITMNNSNVYQLGPLFESTTFTDFSGTGLLTNVVDGVLVFKPIVDSDSTALMSNKLTLRNNPQRRTAAGKLIITTPVTINSTGPNTWATYYLDDTPFTKFASVTNNLIKPMKGLYQLSCIIGLLQSDTAMARLRNVTSNRVIAYSAQGFSKNTSASGTSNTDLFTDPFYMNGNDELIIETIGTAPTVKATPGSNIILNKLT